MCSYVTVGRVDDEYLTEDESATVVDESSNPQTVIILGHGVAFDLQNKK